VVANFSNQSFGNNSPLVPYRVLSAGLSGCDGANGSYWEGESGKPGDPGQPGAQISSTNSGLTIIGGFTANGPNTDSFGAPIVSRGGNGGTGGASGYVLYNEISGGNGGAGGAGGDLTVKFAGLSRRTRSLVWQRLDSSRHRSAARAEMADQTISGEPLKGSRATEARAPPVARWRSSPVVPSARPQAVRRHARPAAAAALAPIHSQTTY
jgi:hypothetical protein